MNTNISMNSDLAREMIDAELGPADWILVPLHYEETNRQMMWQRTRGMDVIRVADHYYGIVVESHRRPNTHNYCESVFDLEHWLENYVDQDDYGIQ